MSDELIYRVKFEADPKSLADLQKAIDEASRQSGGGRGGAGGGSRGRARDNEEEISTIKRLKDELKEKREALAQLNQSARESADASRDMRSAQAELGTEIQTISQQLQEANRGYSDQSTILGQIPNTYAELVEQNRALSIAMKRVPLDDTSGDLESLRKRYAENNVKLKEFDATLGNHQRNVGNYENSLRAVANAVATVQGPLGPLAGRINSLTTFLSRFGQTSDGVVTKMQLLRTVMLSLPIIAIATAIGALTQFFTKSEEGQEKLRVIMAQVSAIMNTLRERAISLGKWLVEIWDEPSRLVDMFKSNIKGAGQALWDNLVERARAIPQYYVGLFDQVIGTLQFFGAKAKSILADVPILGSGIDADQAEKDAEEATKRVLDGFLKSKNALATAFNVDFIVDPIKKVIASVGEIAKEAGENAKRSGELQNELNKELNIRRDLAVERAKQARDLQEAKKDAKDRNLTLDERISKIRAINKLEAELFERELNNEKAILAIMQEQVDMFSSTEQEIQDLTDQKVKVFELEKQNQERTQSALESENELRSKQLELMGAAARKQFEISIGFGELALDARIDQLEREGRLVEAHQERIGAIQMTFGERVLANLSEMRTLRFNEQFSQEEMMAMATQKARLDIEKETQDSVLAMQDAAMQERINQMNLIGNAIGAANEAFFGESKALAVAQTIANTYAAAVAAFKDTPGTPIARGIAAASAIAMGMANVRKILSTKLGDKSVSKGGDSAMRAPNVGTSFGLVDVGTNMPLSERFAGEAGVMNTEMRPVFVFQGDLDPEIMSIKVNEGSNAISSRTLGVGI